MKLPHLVLMLGLTGLVACTTSDRTLHQMRNNRGTPEEFAIVPNKPLEMPQSFAELPTPTPGSANRTDQTPLADAVAAPAGIDGMVPPLLARAAAGVGHALLGQPRKGTCIGVMAMTLVAHLAVPGEAKGLELAQDGIDAARRAAGGIDILDAQAPAALLATRIQIARHRGHQRAGVKRS